MRKVSVALTMLLALAACNAPACPEGAAKKAAQAFEYCLLMQQTGDGGCGRCAYNTFCEAAR